MNYAKPCFLATLTALLALATISTSCRSKPPSYRPNVIAVPMLDGNHIRAWPKEDALLVPVLAEQARLAQKFVYVGSDVGFLTIWGVAIQKPDDPSK